MSTKKEKNNREQSVQKLKAQRQAYLKEVKDYKDRVGPLVRFLRKNKLKFNHASVGNQRIEYFRLDEFEKLFASNTEQIQKDQKLFELFKNSSQELVYFKRPEHIKIKYPKALEPVLPTDPQKKYASFRFDTTQSHHTTTILIIIAVLAIVLFPIWPYQLKYGIWLVSLCLLILIVGIIIIRLAVYLLIAGFNYHVWIFPNFLNSTGFWDSFIPVLEIVKGDKSWFNVFIRLFAISSFLLLATHIYLNPTFLDDNIEFTKQTIQDVHDWGVGKLKNQNNFAGRALTNLETILNQTQTHDSIEDEPQILHEPQYQQPQILENKQQIQQNSKQDL